LILHVPFFTDNDVNHGVGVAYSGLGRLILPQNVLILAGENSVHLPMFGSDFALIYPADSPVIGQSHTNHLEIPGMVLIFLSLVLLYSNIERAGKILQRDINKF
jgi:hypothetical protein